MSDPKLHRVTPEEIYEVAEVVHKLQLKYGPGRAAFMLEQLAKALKTGRFPNGGKAREIFMLKGV